MLLNSMRMLLAGESYWQVQFTSGHTLSELDTKPVELNTQSSIWTPDGRVVSPRPAIVGERARMRKVEWLEDVIGSGDLARVKEVILRTPQGDAHIQVTEPYTVFQFSRGTMAIDPVSRRTIRIKNAQLIGVVTDKETGDCEYAAWDVQTQQLYTGVNNVLNFAAWRDGIIPVGKLNLATMDVRGVKA
jgi:hypothetical protein